VTWVLLRELVDVEDDPATDALVARMLDGAARGRGDVAASYLAGGLAEVIVARAATALRTTGSTWSIGLDDLAIHQDDAGWIEDIESRSTRVVTDVEELVAQIDATMTPLFAALRTRLRLGFVGMWGTVADALFDDPELLELVAARVGTRMRARPRAHLVAWQGGVHRQLVRGTCCLWYKVFPEESGCEASPDGDGYCWSCPHRSDESRAALVAADLASSGS
jgi:hypothetical protein